MIQITPQMRVLVAVEPVDFRCGIDGLAQRCRAVLGVDPFTGTVFVFHNRQALRLLLRLGARYRPDWRGVRSVTSGSPGRYDPDDQAIQMIRRSK